MAERLQPALGGALLSSLRSDQLRVIAPYFAARTLAAGTSICNEGETGDFCVVVLTGSLGVFAARECVDELRAGESWGERALFHGGLRTAELRAVQPSEVACLTLERLGALQRDGAAADAAEALNRQLARLTVLKEAALDRAHMGAAYALDRASMAADEEAVRVAEAMEAQRMLLAQRSDRRSSREGGGGGGGGGGIAAAARLKKVASTVAIASRVRQASSAAASSFKRGGGSGGAEPSDPLPDGGGEGPPTATPRRADDDGDGGGEPKSFAKRSLWQALPGRAVPSVARHWRRFTSEHLAQLSAHLPVVRFKPHEVLLERGQQPSFVGILLRGSAEVLLPAAQAGDAPAVFTVGVGEPLGEMPLFHSVPRSADAVGGADGGTLAICAFHEIEVLRTKQPEAVELLLLLLARTCAWRMLHNASLRSRADARALTSFSAADDSWKQRQLQPLVTDLLDRERQRRWESVGARVTRESAETLLRKVFYKQHVGYSALSLPELYVVLCELPGGQLLPLRCLLHWTVEQVRSRAADEYLRALREEAEAGVVSARVDSDSAPQAAIAQKRLDRLEGRSWRLLTPAGAVLGPPTATLSANAHVAPYVRHDRHAPLRLRPTPRRRRRSDGGAEAAATAVAAAPPSPAVEALLGERLGWSAQSFEHAHFVAAMEALFAAPSLAALAAAPPTLPSFAHVSGDGAVKEGAMLLAQLRLPGGRISTLLVPPSLSGAQLLQRALLELLRCRLQQPVSGEEGGGGAPPTLAELERLLVLRVAGTFDFIDGEASLLSLRCAASCAAEHRPLQLRLMPRAAALAWLYGLPRASALVAADEGAARPPPQPHVLSADASVLPAGTAGELFVSGLQSEGGGAAARVDPFCGGLSPGVLLATGQRASLQRDGTVVLLAANAPAAAPTAPAAAKAPPPPPAAAADGAVVGIHELPASLPLHVCVQRVDNLAALGADDGGGGGGGGGGGAIADAPYSLWVELSLYACGQRLGDAAASRPCTSTLRASARWEQWVALAPLRELPPSARLCCTLYGRPADDGGAAARPRRSSDAGGEAAAVALGWASVLLSDANGLLKSGSLALKLWPKEAAAPDGCVGDNVRDTLAEAALLCLRLPLLPANVRFPPPHAVEPEPAPRGGDHGPLLDLDLSDLDLRAADHAAVLRGKLASILRRVDWGSSAQRRQVQTLLLRWPPLAPLEALELLGPQFADGRVRAFAVRSLMGMTDGQLRPLLLQLTQALKHEVQLDSPLLRLLLYRAASSPELLGAGLFWSLLSERHHPTVRERFGLYVEQVLRACGAHAQQLLAQQKLLRDLAALAEQVQELPKEKRTLALQLALGELQMPEAFGMPSDPRLLFGGLNVEECKVMDSKKAPLFLSLRSVDLGSPAVPLLFKSGDDLRQDALVLQLLSLMDSLWRDAGLQLHMTLYRVTPTGEEQGLISIVQGAATTAKITRAAGGAFAAFSGKPLVDWLRKHNCSEAGFAAARRTFLLSCAGYCVGTYILGIGDRHNDNVMLCRDGRLFHIDFGHFLGNFKSKFGMKRERAPFVFTPDFAAVIGGRDSPAFAEFIRVCGAAFNVLRSHSTEFFRLLSLMLYTGMPELQGEADMSWMTKAFALELSDVDAAAHFSDLIHKSLATRTTQVNNAVHILAH